MDQFILFLVLLLCSEQTEGHAMQSSVKDRIPQREEQHRFEMNIINVLGANVFGCLEGRLSI